VATILDIFQIKKIGPIGSCHPNFLLRTRWLLQVIRNDKVGRQIRQWFSTTHTHWSDKLMVLSDLANESDANWGVKCRLWTPYWKVGSIHPWTLWLPCWKLINGAHCFLHAPCRPQKLWDSLTHSTARWHARPLKHALVILGLVFWRMLVVTCNSCVLAAVRFGC